MPSIRYKKAIPSFLWDNGVGRINPSWMFVLVALLLLASCTGPAAPKAAPFPSPVTPSATPTAAPTVTPTPTATPRPTLTPTATYTPTPVPTSTAAVNIVVEAPKAGQRVASPVRVSGIARVFEGTVVVQVKDAQGVVLQRRSVLASEGAPGWGRFAVEVTFIVRSEQPGTIQVFSPSPKDGSPMNLVTIHVTLVVGP